MTLFSISVFTSSFAQLKITGFGDTLKGNVKKMTEFNNTTGQLIIIESTWDTIANSRIAKYYDEKKSFKGKSITLFDSKGRLTSEDLYCHDGKPCTKLNLQYNKLDRLSNYHYVHYGNSNDSTYPGECNSLFDWLNGQITYWITGFDSSVNIRRHEYDKMGRIVKTEDIDNLVGREYGYTTIKTTNNIYDTQGYKIESKTLNISSNSIDTTVEIAHYRYYDVGDKYVEQTIIRFPLGFAWPDTTVEVTNYKYNNEEVYKPDGLSKHANIEYDQQGNIISIPSLFRREIEYY